MRVMSSTRWRRHHLWEQLCPSMVQGAVFYAVGSGAFGEQWPVFLELKKAVAKGSSSGTVRVMIFPSCYLHT